VTLPGFVNAHSHAFQRALRGRAEGGDFWAWREVMLAEAATLTPARVRDLYLATFTEMRRSGYTAVGEFHYVGYDEALAAAEAAQEAGIELCLLYAAYARGGGDRFRQASVGAYLDEVERLRAAGLHVGVAPHSVRACPRAWFEEIGGYAFREDLVLHVHADEQPAEIEACLAEHGVRPVELLAETGCLGPRTTVVHATNASDGELDRIAGAGARVCLCPTTEASLGDGFAPVLRLVERGIPVCIGSDSNVRIDPLEELRQLEGIARNTSLRRNVIPLSTLLAWGSSEGAAALALERWESVEIRTEHHSLAGVRPDEIEAALVFGSAADVFAPPS
jgi:formimidoylglutamate deiminase